MTKIMKQFDNIEDGIQYMIAAATHDYQGWMQPETEVRTKMNQEFAEGWVIKRGPKYTKILNKNSCYCIEQQHFSLFRPRRTRCSIEQEFLPLPEHGAE